MIEASSSVFEGSGASSMKVELNESPKSLPHCGQASRPVETLYAHVQQKFLLQLLHPIGLRVDSSDKSHAEPRWSSFLHLLHLGIFDVLSAFGEPQNGWFHFLSSGFLKRISLEEILEKYGRVIVRNQVFSSLPSSSLGMPVYAKLQLRQGGASPTTTHRT